VRQIATCPLELPRGPVSAAHLEDVVLLVVAEVESRAQVHDLRRQVAVDGRADRRLGGLDGDLAGPLPQHARDDGAVSFELVPHVVLLSSDRSGSV